LEEFTEASLMELEDLTHISQSTLAIMIEEAGQLLATEKAQISSGAEEASEPMQSQGEVSEQIDTEDQAPEEHLTGDEIGA
jgi:hypothetical protein